MQQPSISCIQSRVENDSSLYGRFLLGPFRVGQGITVANALRRSLLSELTGLAITAIEIDGVSNEYSTIHGIRESVLDILLNIKQIILTSAIPTEITQIAYLQVQGPGVVLAKDIKFPPSIQCINPEQYIAGLSFDGLLRIKFFICKGRSYRSSSQLNRILPFQDKYKEIKKKLNIIKKKPVTGFFAITKSLESNKNKIQKVEIIEEKAANISNLNRQNATQLQRQTNKAFLKKESVKPLNYSIKNNLLPYNQISCSAQKINNFVAEQELSKAEKTNRHLLTVNALFAPVKQVNFLLETDDELKESRDRVILEVWTNGSLLPQEAIHYAVKALIELLTPFLVSPFKNVIYNKSTKLGTELKKSAKLVKRKNITSLDIANLELNLRSYTCLKRAGIETIGDLLKLSPKELLLFKTFDQRSLYELKRAFNEIDISLLHR